MNKNKSIRTLYGFASERLCHYFPNVPLNLVNHVNCVPETISSTGWVYYSHNGKLYALRFEQNSWCELWRWAGRREGRHSVLVIEKKNVNGGSKLGWTLKHLGTLRLWIGDWRVEPRHHIKTQQTKDKKSLTPMPLLKRSWFLEPEICLAEKALILDQEILKWVHSTVSNWSL